MDFSLENWLAGLKDKRVGSGAAGRPVQYAPDGKELAECFGEDEGWVASGELLARAAKRGVSRAAYYRLLKSATEDGWLAKDGGGYRLDRLEA